MRSVVVLAALLLLASPVLAVDLRFNWTQTDITNVDGWSIYWTTTSGTYVPTDVIPVTTSCVDPDTDGIWDCSFDSIGDLADGDYYFVLTSFNVWGESGQSPETTFLFTGVAPPTPAQLGVSQL